MSKYLLTYLSLINIYTVDGGTGTDLFLIFSNLDYADSRAPRGGPNTE